MQGTITQDMKGASVSRWTHGLPLVMRQDAHMKAKACQPTPHESACRQEGTGGVATENVTMITSRGQRKTRQGGYWRWRDRMSATRAAGSSLDC